MENVCLKKKKKIYLKMLLIYCIFSLSFHTPHRIHDACILLTLQTGNAILLHKTIQESTNHELSRNALKEIGVLNVHPIMACDILERRKDVFAY